MTYRVFTNDCGPDGFSCYSVIEADSDTAALKRARALVKRFAPVKVLAIPDELTRTLGTGWTDPGGARFSRQTFEQYGAVVR